LPVQLNGDSNSQLDAADTFFGGMTNGLTTQHDIDISWLFPGIQPGIPQGPDRT
jgi:hypothetical protein